MGRRDFVADSGSDIRRLNIPQPVTVEESSGGLPFAVNLPRREVIEAVLDRWRLDDEWWRTEPVSRLYYSVMLASGRRLVLYKDMVKGDWFKTC